MQQDFKEYLDLQNPDNLVWLDESGIDNNEHYPYGWSKVGDRAFAKRPAYPSHRMSMIAVLNKGEIKAPLIQGLSISEKLLRIDTEMNISNPNFEHNFTISIDQRKRTKKILCIL